MHVPAALAAQHLALGPPVRLVDTREPYWDREFLRIVARLVRNVRGEVGWAARLHPHLTPLVAASDAHGLLEHLDAGGSERDLDRHQRVLLADAVLHHLRGAGRPLRLASESADAVAELGIARDLLSGAPAERSARELPRRLGRMDLLSRAAADWWRMAVRDTLRLWRPLESRLCGQWYLAALTTAPLTLMRLGYFMHWLPPADWDANDAFFQACVRRHNVPLALRLGIVGRA